MESPVKGIRREPPDMRGPGPGDGPPPLDFYALRRPLHLRKRSLKQRLSGSLLALVAMLAGCLVYLDSRLEGRQVLDDYTGRPPDTPGTTWLIVGSDSREGLSEEEIRELHAGGGGGRRADTMMLLHTGRHGTTMVSLPRDTLVPIPGARPNKINAAFAHGGPRLLARTVERTSRIRIDHYAEIGFGGFVGMVDAVGGVEMCLKRRVNDRKAGIDLKPGCQKLDGKAALGYVRSRKAFAGGDLDRARNQRELLAKLVDKATDTKVLANPLRIVPFVLAGTDSFTVGEGDHLWDMAELALALRGVTQGGGTTTTVPVKPGRRPIAGVGSHLRMDPVQAPALFRALREDRPVRAPRDR
jgi:LCP family protein required for cell wall assembly